MKNLANQQNQNSFFNHSCISSISSIKDAITPLIAEIETMEEIRDTERFKPPFAIAHTTVPTPCLSEAQVWNGVSNDGSQVSITGWLRLLIRGTVGLTSGIWSLSASNSDRESLKTTTVTKLGEIKSVLEKLNIDENCLTQQNHETIHTTLKSIQDLLSACDSILQR